MSGVVRESLGGETVAVLRIDRPEKRNALDGATLDDLVSLLRELDADPQVRAIVVRGDERAFAAGADLGDLADADPIALYLSGFSEHWDQVAATRTPLIAAVSGYALGGGLELALACDLMVVADDAVLGFPEARLGIIPGAGGTQRLSRSVGKALALDLLLTGRRLSGAEAARCGLASRTAAAGDVTAEALRMAHDVAVAGPLAAAMITHAVLTSFDVPLSAGIAHERVLSALIAASEDRAEGMRAFRARETPDFRGR